MKKILLTSVISASFLFSASAPSKDYSYEITPFAAGILNDSGIDLNMDNYLNAGIAVAKNLDDSFIDQIELSYLRSEKLDYEGTKNGNTNVNRGFLNLVKQFPLTEKFAIYGLAGLGYQDVTQETKNHQDTALFDYGLGLRYDVPFYGIALKSDIRHLIGLEESQNDFMLTFGLAMPLGKKYSEKISPIVPVIEKVKPTPIVEKPEPKLVIEDEDNDGVINKLDKCPDTSEGIKVNKDGCVATVDLKINFDYNSANVKSGYNEDLAKFAQMLKDSPKLTAVIEAHTDSVGSNAYNQKLSDKRAASVVKELNNLDINTSRLRSIAYGETQPIATNETPEGRAENRRVVGLVTQ